MVGKARAEPKRAIEEAMVEAFILVVVVVVEFFRL